MEAPLAGAPTYGVVCHVCNVAIPLFVDRSRGSSPLPLMGPSRLRVSCDACQNTGYYAVEELVHVEAER